MGVPSELVYSEDLGEVGTALNSFCDRHEISRITRILNHRDARHSGIVRKAILGHMMEEGNYNKCRSLILTMSARTVNLVTKSTSNITTFL